MTHSGGMGTISKIIGPGRSEEEAIKKEWSTYDAVFESLEEQGFHVPSKPNFPPPEINSEDLLTDNNSHFTTMYSKVLSWHNYAKTAYAQVRANLLELQNMLELKSAEIRKECKEYNKTVKKGEGFSAADIEDEVLVHVTQKKLRLEAQKWEQKKLILDALVENLERTMRVISRQVEINRQEIEGETIKNNMGGRGGPPRGFGGR